MIQFTSDWLSFSEDYLFTEFLVKELMRSAARALSPAKQIEMIFWCDAATGGPNVLRISKGLHQKEGGKGDIMHLTMGLYIPGAGENYQIRNTHFRGQFHFYVKLLSSKSKTDLGHSFQPMGLTYQTHANFENVGKDVIGTPILNASVVDRDLRTVKMA